MATITTRVQGTGAKGSPLTNVEVDNNFINLNTDKYESGDSVSLGSGTFTGALAAPAEVRISNIGGNWEGYNEIGRYSFYTTDASDAGARELASIRGIAEDVGTTASGALYFYTSPYNSNVIERVRITDSGDFIFNEGSYSADFRVESDGRSHMLYVDGGTSQVSIAQSLWATNPTSTSLQVEGNLVQSNNEDYARNTFTALSWSGECSWLAGNAYRNYSGKTSGQPLVTTGNCKFLEDRNQYNNSAGILRYVGNGGIWEFHSTSITTGTDTGQDDDIDWSGAKLLSMGSDSAVFNDDSADRDFRVESNTNSNMLLVDGADDTVSIGTPAAANSRTLNVLESINFLDTGNNAGVHKVVKYFTRAAAGSSEAMYLTIGFPRSGVSYGASFNIVVSCYNGWSGVGSTTRISQQVRCSKNSGDGMTAELGETTYNGSLTYFGVPDTVTTNSSTMTVQIPFPDGSNTNGNNVYSVEIDAHDIQGRGDITYTLS